MTLWTGNCVLILFRKHILVYKCKIPDLLKLLLWKWNDGVPKPPVLGSRPNLSWLTTAPAFICIHGILQTSRNVSKNNTWVQTVEGLVILMTTNNLPTCKLDPHTSSWCSEISLFVTWMISEFLWFWVCPSGSWNIQCTRISRSASLLLLTGRLGAVVRSRSNCTYRLNTGWKYGSLSSPHMATRVYWTTFVLYLW